MIRLNEVKFKYSRDKELFLLLNPIMISLFWGCVVPITKGIDPKYKIIITRTISDKLAISVSDTHKEARAIDIRCKDMRKGVAQKLTDELNFYLSERFGAISYSDKKPRFAVLEDFGGENQHIHLQIRSNLPNDIIFRTIKRGIIYTEINKNDCKF